MPRPLQRDELARVLHVRDEEQPGEQCASLRVDAIGEGVATAQDPDAIVVLGLASRMCASGGMASRRRMAARQVGGGELGAARSGAPVYFVRPMTSSWSRQVVAVPVLDEHPDLRATR